MEKIKIDLLPNYFVDEKGNFKKEDALNLCGKIAGVCYNKEGFKALENEQDEKTQKRINLTLNNGHHSVYDHVCVSLNLQNISKALAIVLNNEHQYTTSEKSARYTKIERKDNSRISLQEEVLYNKWVEIFKKEIAQVYGNVFDDRKISKLAQENARYLVTIFMPTTLIYTTSLRQINYLASWMQDYMDSFNPYDSYERNLALEMNEFVSQLEGKNLLVDGLMNNEKHRHFSLFKENLDQKSDVYSDVYSTTYEASWAYLAQAQRHRTLDYQIQRLDTIKENREFKYFIPPIIKDNKELVSQWAEDMKSVKKLHPQGELILINETGSYENFILKCKERLCSAAQLEIMLKTKEILSKYNEQLINNNNPLKDDIKQYLNGARCTFKDFECKEHCKFKEGIKLTRKI